MSLANNTHDISLVDPSDSAEIGFRVYVDNGVLKYQELMMDPLSLLQSVGLVEDASQDPRAMFPVATQSSWVGGFGQEFYDSTEKRRYLASYGMDLSEEQVAKIGPLWTAVAYPTVTAYTLTDGGLELWTANVLDNWTKAGGGTLAKEATEIHTGGSVYSAKITTGASATTVKSNTPTWSTEYRLKRFRASAWCHAVAASKFRIAVTDSSGTTYSSYHSGGGDWEQLTVTREIATGATSWGVVLCGVLDAGAVVGYFDDVTLTGYMKGTSTVYAEYAGKDYMASGDIVFSRTAIDELTIVYTYAFNVCATITDMVQFTVSTTNYLFICTTYNSDSGEHSKIWYWDGTTLTQATGTDAQGDYAAVVGTNFYLADPPNTVRVQTEPKAGNFSTAYTFGTSETNITGLSVLSGLLHVAKEDQLYYLTAAGVATPIAPDLRGYYAAGAGKNACVQNNQWFVPMKGALIWYDADTGNWDNISPASLVASTGPADTVSAMMLRKQADFDDDIVAITPFPEGIYAMQDNGSKVNIFKGRFAVIDGAAAWHWHPVAETTLTAAFGVRHAFAYSVLSGSARLWTGNGTSNPGSYELTKYQTSSGPYFVTPWYVGGLRHISKALYQFVGGLQNILKDHYYVTVTYQKYGDASWATLTTFNTTLTTGEGTAFLPANSYSPAFRFKAAMQTDDSAQSPQLNYLRAEGKVKLDEVAVIQTTVELSDNQLQRNGARDGWPASRKETCLDNVVNSDWPVTMYDLDGTLRTVDIMKREQVGVYREAGKSRVKLFDIVAHKVTLS